MVHAPTAAAAGGGAGAEAAEAEAEVEGVVGSGLEAVAGGEGRSGSSRGSAGESVGLCGAEEAEAEAVGNATDS